MEIDVHTSQIVDFAVIHMTRLGDRMVEVASFDLHLDEFHMHHYGKSSGAKKLDRDVFFAIDNLADIQHAYDRAQDLVVEGYEENKRRWRNG